MKKTIKQMIKGAFIGIANIIPGVSGGTLAITMGIYEDLIAAISNLFGEFKKNIKFLMTIGSGAVLAILLMSKLLKYTLTNFQLATVLFFIGLILGGLPMLLRKVKGKKKIGNLVIFMITFSTVIIFSLLNGKSAPISFSDLNVLGYVSLFLVGILSAATMVIPGISGSFILMIIGYYEPLINIISDLTNLNHLGQNLTILIPFGLGVVIGIILIAKLIQFLLKRFEIQTYFGIIGFVIASIITILISLKGVTLNLPEILIGIVLAIIGFLVAYKLEE